jgi:predicted membrane channel-forming protein YqfA (hemolysin III family)
MSINLLLVLAFIVVGGYRVYASRADKNLALAWALLVTGSIAAPLSKLVSVGKLPILVVGGVCFFAGAVLFGRRRKPEHEQRIPRG